MLKLSPVFLLIVEKIFKKPCSMSFKNVIKNMRHGGVWLLLILGIFTKAPITQELCYIILRFKISWILKNISKNIPRKIYDFLWNILYLDKFRLSAEHLVNKNYFQHPTWFRGFFKFFLGMLHFKNIFAGLLPNLWVFKNIFSGTITKISEYIFGLLPELGDLKKIFLATF